MDPLDFCADATERDDQMDPAARSPYLADCMRQAVDDRSGNFARRVAELLEARDGADAETERKVAEFDGPLHRVRPRARPWWRYAAFLGDLDAVDYVVEILAESPWAAVLLGHCQTVLERAMLLLPSINTARTATLGEDRVTELADAIKAARAGNASAARRCGELFEAGGDFTGSRPWFQYAASLGDESATVTGGRVPHAAR